MIFLLTCAGLSIISPKIELFSFLLLFIYVNMNVIEKVKEVMKKFQLDASNRGLKVETTFWETRTG